MYPDNGESAANELKTTLNTTTMTKQEIETEAKQFDQEFNALDLEGKIKRIKNWIGYMNYDTSKKWSFNKACKMLKATYILGIEFCDTMTDEEAKEFRRILKVIK